ncbi:MAG: ABC transporter ATP-binding protein/permease [Firmicutes bacterium]|nr:ABC transporter ATP-binding protein/permease [Bacillota bacterium]
MWAGGGGFGGGPGHGFDRADGAGLSRINRKVLLRLWEHIWPFRFYFLLGVILMFIVSLSGLAGPYLLKVAIDQYITRGDLAGVTRIALIYLGLFLLNWLATYSQTYIISWTGQSVIFSIRMGLFQHLQRLGFTFYDRLEAGRIMSRVTNDVDALNQLVSSGLVSLVNDFLTIFGIIIIMIKMDYHLALVSFTTIPLIIALVAFFQIRMTRAFHRVRRRIADVNATLQESISGMKTIQAFSREEVNLQRFDSTNQENLQANLQVATLTSVFFPMVELIGAIGTSLVVWYGGWQIAGHQVSLGTLVAFLGYVTRFFMPIRDLSQVYNLFLSATVSTERIFEFLDEEPDVKESPGAEELLPLSREIRFEEVTFGYDPSLPVLKGVNLQARAGETVALVGPTGAGKTSIINLLGRFYDPQDGRITVDGTDIRAVTLLSLRRQMGVVLQDTFIFSGTIKENIRYGRLEATDEEVVAAAQAVGAHDFILRFPEGYDTEVNERGSKLSVGQRQLLAFARALIANPRILILDEATSSVDAYTELLIQQALERLLAGRTAFVIAHRLSTIRNAARIYVIEDGRVVESGRHDELLARDGRYAELYQKQFAGAVATH